MFFHIKELAYEAKPERPDPVFAKKIQELIGGQFGEMSVMNQYLFQAWGTRKNDKYRDLLLDTGTEEIGHIELLSTMVARLLDDAPVTELETAAATNPAMAAIIGGMNPQHAIVSGLAAMPKDSVGVPWNGGYVAASGNLLADMRANLNAESQGRLQAVRLFEQTDDRGIKDMLSFLIARDTMHQNQWLAAIYELEQKEGVVVPSTFPRHLEKTEVSYLFLNHSMGDESSKGRWASGPSMDGMGTFQYVRDVPPFGSAPKLKPAPPAEHNTPPNLK
ncbi:MULTISPECIES: manganese catalase family protein [Niallia]|jgi:Mn-containing catalase|uniref:Manganese catalase n=1 Tax=Niallia circulans TaxID=1397 RepID=A0A268FCL0_NIACI|nr:manganese catalase family protein [Niallia circulans]AYV67845.1 manganese catalase [Niallia circulans]AYV73805.1 manganese catalase [Niallia circulans]NRG26354.1 manganese catalase family protein [Niallia circulans]PAD83112.1 manganese catalase [Niallia circulans]QJX63758.1 manganese catalase family protein [Niallia circulans]